MATDLAGLNYAMNAAIVIISIVTNGTNLLLQLVYGPGDLLVATLLVLLGHGLRQVLF